MSKTVVLKATNLYFIISSDQVAAKGERVDRVLSRLEGLPSRSQVKDWFLEGRIRRGPTEVLDSSSKVFPGDKIFVSPKAPKIHHLTPKKIPLEILFEDESLIVIYKPKGLSMHPGAGDEDRVTLVHGLLAHSQSLSSVNGEFRPGIVHRLDKDTEGIVVVAKDNRTHETIAEQFSSRSIQRAYWALVWGKFPTQLTIEANIARNPRDRKKMAIVSRGGKPAKTEVKLLKHFSEGYSWVECKLHTGRTHQIRVHLTSKKYGLLGDEVYGRARKIDWSSKKQKAYEKLAGQALVAFRLGFRHPKTGKEILFQIEKPGWLKVLTEEETSE